VRGSKLVPLQESADTANPVPLRLWETVRAPVVKFVSVSFRAGLVVLLSTLPKATLTGINVVGVVLVPLRATLGAMPSVMSVMLSVSLASPLAAVGAKSSETLQTAKGASVLPQVVDAMAKPFEPDTSAGAPRSTTPSLVFFTVTVLVALPIQLVIETVLPCKVLTG
jgi:hypothetical protein